MTKLRDLLWRTMALWLPVLVIAGAGVARVEDPLLVSTLRNSVFDAYQRWKPREYQEMPVKILDIDEESLRRLGQWPWPRTLMADIVQRLGDLGVAVVTFDIVFAEEDRTSPSRLRGELPPSRDLERFLDALPDHDEEFSRALQGVPAVAGFALTDAEGASDPPKPKWGVATAGGDPLPYLLTFDNALSPLPKIIEGAAGLGAINFVPTVDGVVRQVPLLLASRGQIFPSLSAETLRVAQGAKTFIVKSVGASGEGGYGAATGITHIKIGQLPVPTDAEGRVWIHHSYHNKNRYIPIWKLIDNEISPEKLGGAIVLVGTSAVGLHDLRLNPLREALPGVEIQAQVLEQVLSGQFLTRPDWAIGAEIVLQTLLAIVIIVLGRRFGALPTALVGGAAVAGAVGTSMWAFASEGILLDPLFPSLTAVVVYTTGSLLRHVQAERERGYIRKAFASYVSPNLVQALIENPDHLKLGGERKELSFIFSDLADFTPLVEQFTPDDLIPMLNEYLNEIIAIGFKHGGTLDAIIGDATTFFFNAPIEQADHAERAMACALEMDDFANAFQKKKVAEGIPLGKTRIGVHTGPVIIGNMGGNVIFNYCAHGDAINTAARLESVNKHLGTRMCISGHTVDRCAEFSGRPVGSLVLKGKSEDLPTFEPMPPDEVASERVQSYIQAFRAMENEDPMALGMFQTLHQHYPDDPLIKLHLRRLEGGRRGVVIVMSEK